MAITYKFKTNEDIDNKSRTIVKSELMPTSTEETEFTLEQKENELENAKKLIVDTQEKVKSLKAEIAEIKKVLKIKDKVKIK